ncbi:MAG: hypothetical protein AAF958_03750 [Planctomycetota bacterium]
MNKTPHRFSSLRKLVFVAVLGGFLISESRSVAAQGPNAPNQAGGNRTTQRDPTVPSAEIQRRTRPRPAAAPTPAPVTRRTPTPTRLTPIRRQSEAVIELQSLVQSSADGCTATLKSGDQLVTVSFSRTRDPKEIQLPQTQFADFASTVQRLSLELRQLRAQAIADQRADAAARAFDQQQRLRDAEASGQLEADSLPTPNSDEKQEDSQSETTERIESELLNVEQEFMRSVMRPRSIDLASSFTLDGRLYRILDFTGDTLLLEQIPLGRFLIVR